MPQLSDGPGRNWLWTWDFNGIIDEFRFSSVQRSPGMASYSPLNDHSLIVRNADGTYTRTLKDGTKMNFNAEGLHTSIVIETEM